MKIIFVFFILVFSKLSFGNDFYSIDFKKTRSLNAPTVILLHGCDGPNLWTSDWTYRLSSWGYNVVIPSQFHKRGETNICNRGWIISPKTRLNDLESIIEWVNKQNWHNGKIALIGMSHGGATAISAAIDNRFKQTVNAAVSFYPGCGLIREDFTNPLIPVMVHLGAKDAWTPCLEKNWINYKTFIYENAGHSFDIQLGYRNYMGHELWYDRSASLESQKHTKEFLDRILK